MKVSTLVLVAIVYTSTTSALPIANGSNSRAYALHKRQSSGVIVPITPGTALISPGMVAPGGTHPGAIQPDAVNNEHPSGFPATPTPVVVPIASPLPITPPTAGFMPPQANLQPSGETSSTPVVVPIPSLSPGFMPPSNNLEPSKPGGIPPGSRSPLAFQPGQQVPDTIWDQIVLQPPGTFEKALDDLVFESKTPNTLTPLLAQAR
ncbi:hypothetical protein TWF281_000288 [Arthrobotrys megalospora]